VVSVQTHWREWLNLPDDLAKLMEGYTPNAGEGLWLYQGYSRRDFIVGCTTTDGADNL